jgi:hypothetical protein
LSRLIPLTSKKDIKKEDLRSSFLMVSQDFLGGGQFNGELNCPGMKKVLLGE